jgi:hypothetical protein
MVVPFSAYIHSFCYFVNLAFIIFMWSLIVFATVFLIALFQLFPNLLFLWYLLFIAEYLWGNLLESGHFEGRGQGMRIFGNIVWVDDGLKCLIIA